MNVDYIQSWIPKRILKSFLCNGPCDKVAIENPISLKVFNMPEFATRKDTSMDIHLVKKQDWLKALPN